MLRRKMLSVEALKRFISYVRCASYPDPELHQRYRGAVEKSWPAYYTDQTLARLPSFFWTEQAASGATWKDMYEKALAARTLTHEPSHSPTLGPRRRPHDGRAPLFDILPAEKQENPRVRRADIMQEWISVGERNDTSTTCLYVDALRKKELCQREDLEACSGIFYPLETTLG